MTNAPKLQIVEGSTPVNPFSPDALRLTQDFVGLAGVKKELTTCRAKRPGKHTWFRTSRSRLPAHVGGDRPQG